MNARRLLLGLVIGLFAKTASATQSVYVYEHEEQSVPTAEIGLYAGEPTGISAKYWFSPWSGIDGALSWRFPNEGYSFHADYVMHSWALHNSFPPNGPKIPLYAGAGVKALHLSDNPEWGARFPIGVNAIFDLLPISVFAEVAPGVVFEQKAPRFNGDAGIGARVYF